MDEIYNKLLFRKPYNYEYEIFKKNKLIEIEKIIIKTNEYKEIINYTKDNFYFIKSNFLDIGNNINLIKINLINIYKLFYIKNINEVKFIDFIDSKFIEYLNKIKINYNKNLENLFLINFIKDIFKFLLNDNENDTLENLYNKHIKFVNLIKYNIAILVHIGEYDLWNTILNYIKNINDLTYFDLYVNITKYEDGRDYLIENLKKKILEFKSDTYITINNNIGMDIGGFLKQFKLIKEMNKSYSYILKLHTKKNDIWRNELYNPIIGSKDIVINCLSMFDKNKNIGMISCKKWLINMDTLNKPIINNIMKIYNLKNNSQQSLFVGGTIFWMKYEILDKFFTIKNIDNIYSTLEKGHMLNFKPTHVHSWERMFGILVNTYNYKYYSF